MHEVRVPRGSLGRTAVPRRWMNAVRVPTEIRLVDWAPERNPGLAQMSAMSGIEDRAGAIPALNEPGPLNTQTTLGYCGRFADWNTSSPGRTFGVMDQILPPELSDFELEALRQLAAHPATQCIPSAIQSRLKDIGYVKEVLAASL